MLASLKAGNMESFQLALSWEEFALCSLGRCYPPVCLQGELQTSQEGELEDPAPCLGMPSLLHCRPLGQAAVRVVTVHTPVGVSRH